MKRKRQSTRMLWSRTLRPCRLSRRLTIRLLRPSPSLGPRRSWRMASRKTTISRSRLERQVRGLASAEAIGRARRSRSDQRRRMLPFQARKPRLIHRTGSGMLLRGRRRGAGLMQASWTRALSMRWGLASGQSHPRRCRSLGATPCGPRPLRRARYPDSTACRPAPRKGTGSEIIIHHHLYILTNRHRACPRSFHPLPHPSRRHGRSTSNRCLI